MSRPVSIVFLVFVVACVALARAAGEPVDEHAAMTHLKEQMAERAAAADKYSAQGESLVFSDEFDEFNLTFWEHEITAGGGGNWEFQYYVNNRSNSYVKDGVLYMKPTLTEDLVGPENLKSGFTLNLWGSQPADTCTGNAFFGCERTSGVGGNIISPIQSARIRSSRSFSTKYGRVEINAKLPRGDWLWPAIWLLPRYNYYGSWPASGEIDIMESRGNRNYPGGVDSFGSTLHWGPYYAEDAWPKSHEIFTLPGGKDLSDDFHIYGLYWDETEMYTYIDSPNQKVLQLDYSKTSFWERGGWDKSNYDNPWSKRSAAAPFDQEFYMIFNVAVGGINSYFPDGVGNKPWTNSDPHAVNAFYNAKHTWYTSWEGERAAMQIDYMRVYQKR